MAEDIRTVAGIALTVFAAAQVPSFFSGFLPDLLTVGTDTDDSNAQVQRFIRRGEANAIGLALLTGLGTSYLSKSLAPFLVCACVAAFYTWQYEDAFTSRPADAALDIRDDV